MSEVNESFRLFIYVDETAFESQTIQAFLTLRDFYYAEVCTDQDTSSEANTAKNAFLDAMMDTDIMKATETFAYNHGINYYFQYILDF